MANLYKVTISPKNPAISTVVMPAMNRQGELDENMDFFRDSLQDDWWGFLENTSVPKYHETLFRLVQGCTFFPW